ncbi:MAG: endonuclease/exonuclease/phosphatase family protein, partial [Pseudomonadota bacterium]
MPIIGFANGTQAGAATDESATNATSFTVTTADGVDPVNWGPGDWFGWGAFGAFPQSAGVPFALADDSVIGVSGSAFAGDTQGIIGQSTAATDEFFGVVDTVNGDNPGGTATAVWTFDITGEEELSFSVDVAAMGDFEASGDSFEFSYQIDGGAVQTLFSSTVDEAGAQNYTMDSGAVVNLNDPLQLGGVTLDDSLQTLTESIDGTGSELTVTFTASTDGGSEGFVFDNLLIESATPTVINEILASHTGADNTEFVELFGAPGASLDGLSLISIEGEASAGSIDEQIDFGPTDFIGENGFFLVGNSEGLLGTYGVTPNIDLDPNFENGDSTYALVETASITGSTVTGAEVVLDSVALTAPPSGGTEDGTFFFGAPIVGPDGSFFPAGVRRVEDGVDTDDAADFAISDFFLGVENTPTAGTGPQAPVINEVLVSHTGTDDTEFFEIFASPNTSLDGLSFVAVDAQTGEYEFIFDFGADDATGDNGFFLVGNPTGLLANYGVTPNANLATDSLQNNSATYALVETASLPGGVGTTVSGSEVVIDAVASTDPGDDPNGGTPGNFAFDAPVLGPDGSFLPAGVRRVEDGVDTDDAADFVIGNFFLSFDNTPTAGESDNGGGGIPTPATIMQLQGVDHVSTFNGELVVTSGIVTAVDSNGFYLQDPTGDDDITTSDGIFVLTGSAPTVAVGDEAEVTGNLLELGGGQNLSVTQISLPSDVTVISSDNALPAPVVIGQSGRIPPDLNINDDAFASFDPETDGQDFFESLEGMRVTVEDASNVSPTDGNEFYVVANQGADATGLSSRGTLNNDPLDFNPERVLVVEDTGVFDLDFPDVNVGADLGDITGVLNYAGGEYELRVTEGFEVEEDSTLRRENTELRGTADQLTIASYNVLNLDPGDDAARFAGIGAQIANNLGAPDIVGLQEVQDNSGATDDGTTSADVTLQLLVDAIAEAGGPQYAFIDNTFITDGESGGQPGGNIRTAYLYRTDRVSVVPESVQPVGDQLPGSPFDGARLPLSVDFAFNGETVTVVNNHFSSKGGSVPLFGSVQPTNERQEETAVNGSLDERQAQSTAVQSFVNQILIDDPDANVVVLGDLNEFEFVSPVLELETNANLTNLTNTLGQNEAHTFIFQGNSQALDHVLV